MVKPENLIGRAKFFKSFARPILLFYAVFAVYQIEFPGCTPFRTMDKLRDMLLEFAPAHRLAQLI